jgi:transcriptional adapter 3
MQNGPSHGGLAVPHFIPAVEMKDENLVDEQRGLGAITERIVAAVIGEGENRDMEGKPAEEVDSAREPAKVDVVDLEERMKQELRAVMLLGEHEEVS